MKRKAKLRIILLNKVKERVAQATSVSHNYVQRILREQKSNVEAGEVLSTPRKKQLRNKTKSEIDKTLTNVLFAEVLSNFIQQKDHIQQY